MKLMNKRKNWYNVNQAGAKNANRKCRQKRKLRCLIHYGGSSPKCACCGESHFEFLTIDHNGQPVDNKHRSGDNLYGWLIKNNFPEGYQVLCLNCNHCLGHNGYCPHQNEVEIL